MSASINNAHRYNTLPFLSEEAKLALFQIEDEIENPARQGPLVFRYTCRQATTQQVKISELQVIEYRKLDLTLVCTDEYRFQLQRNGLWEVDEPDTNDLGLTNPPLATQFVP